MEMMYKYVYINTYVFVCLYIPNVRAMCKREDQWLLLLNLCLTYDYQLSQSNDSPIHEVSHNFSSRGR